MSAADWGVDTSRAAAQVQHEPEPLIPVETGLCEDCGAPLDIEGDCVACDWSPEVDG